MSLYLIDTNVMGIRLLPASAGRGMTDQMSSRSDMLTLAPHGDWRAVGFDWTGNGGPAACSVSRAQPLPGIWVTVTCLRGTEEGPSALCLPLLPPRSRVPGGGHPLPWL